MIQLYLNKYLTFKTKSNKGMDWCSLINDRKVIRRRNLSIIKMEKIIDDLFKTNLKNILFWQLKMIKNKSFSIKLEFKV